MPRGEVRGGREPHGLDGPKPEIPHLNVGVEAVKRGAKLEQAVREGKVHRVALEEAVDFWLPLKHCRNGVGAAVNHLALEVGVVRKHLDDAQEIVGQLWGGDEFSHVAVARTLEALLVSAVATLLEALSVLGTSLGTGVTRQECCLGKRHFLLWFWTDTGIRDASFARPRGCRFKTEAAKLEEMPGQDGRDSPAASPIQRSKRSSWTGLGCRNGRALSMCAGTFFAWSTSAIVDHATKKFFFCVDFFACSTFASNHWRSARTHLIVCALCGPFSH